MSSLDDLIEDLTSGDEARAEAAVIPLKEMGEAALPALYALLESPELDHRWWAIRVLAETEQVDVRRFIQALRDPNEEIRQCAALALATHPTSEALQALCQALSDSDSLTANLAATALIALESEATPFLLEVQKAAPLSARIQAMRALSEIADPRAIPAMMSALDEDSVFIRHWAESGLERLGLNTVYIKPESL